MSVRAACFWASAGGAAWTLAGYPLFLLLLPARPWRRDEATPRVTVIVPAFREREALRRKLEALRELDYPRERLETIVAIDEDEELVGVARAAYPDAIVTFSAERSGKVGGLNRALAQASGDVVLMTDANNVLDRGSVRAAVAHFADDAVWAVAGRRGEVASAYDRYEDLLRRLETRSGCVAAMSGEFMAVRRERLPDVFPEDVVNDDFWLLCRIVREGGRVVYEAAAASTEEALDSAADELARRSRIGAGRAMLVSELHGLPRDFAVRIASHKLARLALPFLLAGALLSSASLASRRPYALIAAAQASVYGLGAASAAGIEPPGPAGRLARAARQFVVGNVAVGVGVVRAARGRQSTKWQAVR